MSTLDTLRSIMSEEYRMDPARLEPGAKLDELGVDSLHLLELMFKIEDRFDLKLKDDIPRSLATVQDVVDYIDGQLAGQQTAAAPVGGSAQPP